MASEGGSSNEAQALADHKQLLEHCACARRSEALGLLDQQPGLLNLHWAGEMFKVNGRWANVGTTALILASKSGDLGLVLALLERGANIHAQDCYNWTALIGAARWASGPEVCELLLSKGINLIATDRDGETALSFYGRYSGIDRAEKEAGRKRLREAWASGPHPSQVLRRCDENWARRWPFVQVMVLGGFQPLAARRAALGLSAQPTDVALARLPCVTATEHLGLLRAKAFSHPGIWRAIAAFL